MEMFSAMIDSPVFTWVVLPILIFASRVLDVSIGTIRVIFVARGQRLWAPLLGFFEVLVWLLAIGQIMQKLTNPLYYIAYAGGFAAGNFVGMWIEDRLALGKVLIRAITRTDASELIEQLKTRKNGLTYHNARGVTGPVHIIFTVTDRHDAPKVIELIRKHNPRAFYTVEDVRSVRDTLHRSLPGHTRWFHRFRVAKKK